MLFIIISMITFIETYIEINYLKKIGILYKLIFFLLVIIKILMIMA